jgi:hypothetical protein
MSSLYNVPAKPPHKFFSKLERSVLRTLICADETAEWYTLPGLENWWPDRYDYAARGFAPEENRRMIEGRKNALAIFSRTRKISAKTFESLEWNVEEFCIL